MVSFIVCMVSTSPKGFGSRISLSRNEMNSSFGSPFSLVLVYFVVSVAVNNHLLVGWLGGYSFCWPQFMSCHCYFSLKRIVG